MDIIVNTSKNNIDFFHLKFNLNFNNVLLIEKQTDYQLALNGGQFDVLINKKFFPIDSPNCTGNIILRMPWSDGANGVSEKVSLYNEIKRSLLLKQDYTVIIELNPYVKRVNDHFTLTSCNIYFRQFNGRYIADTNPLPS